MHATLSIFIAAARSPLDESLLALLGPEERTRLLRFSNPARKAEFATGRAVLRRVLSERLGEPASEIELILSSEGKPMLDPRYGPGLGFSLSHSEGTVAVAVRGAASGSMDWQPRIGIDVERARASRETAALARRFFHPDERDFVLAAPDEETRERRFLCCWTLKEAYLKALGIGLRGPLSAFGFRFEPERSALHLVDPGASDRFDFRVLGIHPRGVLALAWDREPSAPGPNRSHLGEAWGSLQIELLELGPGAAFGGVLRGERRWEERVGEGTVTSNVLAAGRAEAPVELWWRTREAQSSDVRSRPRFS